jgi:hypothetical protein
LISKYEDGIKIHLKQLGLLYNLEEGSQGWAQLKASGIAINDGGDPFAGARGSLQEHYNMLTFLTKMRRSSRLYHTFVDRKSKNLEVV